MSRQSNFFKNAIFRPSVIRKPGGRVSMTLSQNAQDNFGTIFPSGSFRFDPAGSPLKSTQQLNVDFSKFENHTFFNSAKNKVHIAFEKILNQFPFDGKRSEYENFIEKLSGFEKYVLDSFPKSRGFLIFDRVGSNPGSFLTVKDLEGSGESVQKSRKANQPLNILGNPFTVEFNIFVPSGSVNHNEIITQRISGSREGFTIALSDSSGLSSPFGECDIFFQLSDGLKSQSVTTRLSKGKFNHIAAVYDRGDSNMLSLYVDGERKSKSPGTIETRIINYGSNNLMIGSGSLHGDFLPVNTLSGALDDYRFFMSSRAREDILRYKNREIFSQDDLKLYFRFNEPSGSYDKNGFGRSNLCLDHSGNGLHAAVNNFNINQRDHKRIEAQTMLEEDPQMSPVLFPSFESVHGLFEQLIMTASLYDLNNPNLITNLVPPHYLSDSKTEAVHGVFGTDLEQQPGIKQDEPGGNQLRQSEIISSVLFMWAEVFDETKMFIDEMSRLLKVDYTSNETISDQLLPFLAKYHSFSLPSQFNHATIEQQKRGRNITYNEARANRSLQDIQNIIWRRILSDLPEIRRTKGTRSSIESVLRNVGINPGTTFRIKEYGGPSKREIGNNFEKRTQIGKMLTFSGSNSQQGAIDAEGRDSRRPLITSPFLSGSRTEPGFPKISGEYVNGTSNNPSDGLFTSSSWSYEGLYKFESNVLHGDSESLARLQTTGSSSGVSNSWLIYNIVARKERPSEGVTGSLHFYGKPSGNSSSEFLISLPGVNVFDGQQWNVSFGRRHSNPDEHMSSSYYLRAGSSNFGREPTIYSASLYYPDEENNAINNIDASYNASGSYIAIGSMSLGYDSSSPFVFLNQVSSTEAQTVNFTGKVSNVRFFSKDITDQEYAVHVENPKSLGVLDPNKNFNFTNRRTGSFERLRINYEISQELTNSSDQGTASIFDFTQNNLHGRGTGFEPDASIFLPETYNFRTLTPKLETQVNENKVRIRSFLSQEIADKYQTGIAPIYEIFPAETPNDDRRVAIEVSSVQALNDDIALIFGSLDYFDNAIGDPELVFSGDYRSLRDLRRIYFNRLEDKVSLVKFFSFFKWFDDTVGDVLEELIPTTSRYLGTNFVIESHALERPKFMYQYSDMYLGELERPDPGKIYLQQFIGIVRKR